MSSTKSNIVLNINDWNTNAIKYMAPRITQSKGKAISMISTQTNRVLNISTPLMLTWGINDFVDENGESDGKFQISLQFPNSEYANAQTDEFLRKFKDFENQVIDDAVKNSENWWGEEMDRGIVKHTLFPFLKYSKDKLTKKIDLTKAPSIRAKVPNYDGKWSVEIYDPKGQLLFPCENHNLSPMDFVPKQSRVACVLQCGGIWIGGKGWGVTWKLIQCVVKKQEIEHIFGKCHIQLSDEDTNLIETQGGDKSIMSESEDPDVIISTPTPTPTPVVVQSSKPAPTPTPVVVQSSKPAPTPTPVPISTMVEDSDDEGNEGNEGNVHVTPTPAIQIQEPVTASPVQEQVVQKKTVKKIVKKAT